MRSAAIVLAFVAVCSAVPVPQDGHHGGGYAHAGRSNWSGDYDGHVDAQPNWQSDWNAANENYRAGQQRIAAANAAAVNAANQRYSSAISGHHNNNPRWACNLPGAVCTDDQPQGYAVHGHGQVAQHRQDDGHHQVPRGHYYPQVYHQHQHQPSPWRDAPADPRSLWACAVNPSACTHDVNWATRVYNTGHQQAHQG